MKMQSAVPILRAEEKAASLRFYMLMLFFFKILNVLFSGTKIKPNVEDTFGAE